MENGLQASMNNRVLILANNEETIFHFRLELIEALNKGQYEVTVSAPVGKYKEAIESRGAEELDITMEQHGTNPIKDLCLIARYLRLITKIKPGVVLTYTIKPNIYGGFACSLLKVPCIGTVTGLGKAFEKEGILKRITFVLYRLGIKNDRVVFFQNPAQRDYFYGKKSRNKMRLVPGSGVNLSVHKYEPYPHNEETRFIFIGDVVKDKGLFELMDSFERLRSLCPISLQVVGAQFEEYPIEQWEHIPDVSFLGRRSDIHELISQADTLVLPSYHEGLANVILEASGCGRPVIATDIPGCREAIEDGVTGFLVAPKDADALFAAMQSFVNMPTADREAMGVKACEKVKKEFDRNIVVDAYVNEINGIVKEANS